MYTESNDLIINLTVTDRCYARCRDCINSTLTIREGETCDTAARECDPDRDSNLIQKIASRYPGRTVTVCFYGGEPFLDPQKMDRTRALVGTSEIGDRVRYMVYTTGELVAGCMEKYSGLIRGMWLYSVSIDGRAEQHESVRPGTSMSKTLRSLESLRRSYTGNILVWSTLREQQSLLDCFRQFMWMHGHGLANHFFWHWADTTAPFADFPGYSAAYERELIQVMDEYMSFLSRGELLPIAHINELVLYYLEKRERGHTACAVEIAEHYDVLGGRVHACADLPERFQAFGAAGSVDIPADALQSLVAYKRDLGCGRCEAHWYCGGRCPVQAMAGSHERTSQICSLMRHHIQVVGHYCCEIRNELERHSISHQALYDRSAFMARYTDVVP